MQDLGTAQRAEQQPAAAAASALGDWHDVGGGEAGYVVSRPDRPEHRLRRRVRRHHHALRPPHAAGAQRQRLPDNPLRPRRPRTCKYRFQWTAPIARLAARPEDGLPRRATCSSAPPTAARRWERDQPRPDAQRQDASRSGPAARSPATTPASRSTAPSSPSPSRRSRRALLWAGSDDGLVHVTRDGGKTWTNVTGDDPGPARVGHGQPASSRRRFDAGTAYVVVDAHRLDDMRPYLWKTTRLRQDLEAPRRRRCRRTSTCTPCARTRAKPGCSTSAPSAACMFSRDDGATLAAAAS